MLGWPPKRSKLTRPTALRPRNRTGGKLSQSRGPEQLAETVRLRREEQGWSQRQLAERAGMSQPGVARFQAGGTTPTLPLLERLAEALGLTLTVSLGPGQRRSAAYQKVLERSPGGGVGSGQSCS